MQERISNTILNTDFFLDSDNEDELIKDLVDKINMSSLSNLQKSIEEKTDEDKLKKQEKKSDNLDIHIPDYKLSGPYLFNEKITGQEANENVNKKTNNKTQQDLEGVSTNDDSGRRFESAAEIKIQSENIHVSQYKGKIAILISSIEGCFKLSNYLFNLDEKALSQVFSEVRTK